MGDSQRGTTLDSLQAEVDTLNKKCNSLLLLILEQQANIIEMVAAMEEAAILKTPSTETVFRTARPSTLS